MAVAVSLINMKGGVGKTTLAAQLAYAAARRNLKTLAVDLDPQSNLSQALLGPERYVKLLRDRKPTVVALFERYLPPFGSESSMQPVEIEDVILKKLPYSQKATLDLVPSQLELSHTLKNSTGKERRLARALSRVSSQYDLILIDCAPTESILTVAAYYASRYALVPVKPEFLATIGLPLLAQSIEIFRDDNTNQDLDICGIVFNHSSAYSEGPESRRSIKEVTVEANKNGWHVYKKRVGYSASYPRSAREGTPISSTSYARWDVAEGFSQFVDEFLVSVGVSGAKQ